MDHYIGLDLGTTGCKAMVMDEAGGVKGETYIEYPLIVRSDTVIEQDARLWWQISARAIREAVGKSGVDISRLRALSISSQGLAFVALDKNGIEIGNAISWLDTRAAEETTEILSRYDEAALFRITGKKANAMYTLPKLMWLRRHMHDAYRKAEVFLMPLDYLLYRMTGECVTDHSMASGTMLYDVSKQQWSQQIADSFEIDLNKLARLKWSGETVGEITKTAASETGLPESLLIVNGGQDQKVAAFGAGLEVMNASVSLGTASAIEFRCDLPLIDPAMGLPAFSYLEKDSWVLEGVLPTSGAAIKWARNTLMPDLSYADMDTLAEKAKPGAGGLLFYPHLAGMGSPGWDETARGSFCGLSLDTDRGDIIRAIYEGLAYNIFNNILHAGKLGIKPGKLYVFGGAGRSPVICRILSDVTGLPVRSYRSPELANLGAGMLAAKGFGADINSFGKGMLSQYSDSEPNLSVHDTYIERLDRYLRLENRLAAESLGNPGQHR